MGTTAPRVQDRGEDSVLEVRVTPTAQRTRFLGVREEILCIAVNSPPEKGRANQALAKFLARTLGLSRSSLTLISGETSRLKRFAISGLNADEVRKRLEGQL